VSCAGELIFSTFTLLQIPTRSRGVEVLCVTWGRVKYCLTDISAEMVERF
jgi:hypothetical protein